MTRKNESANTAASKHEPLSMCGGMQLERPKQYGAKKSKSEEKKQGTKTAKR